jgi:hypothetical protein
VCHDALVAGAIEYQRRPRSGSHGGKEMPRTTKVPFSLLSNGGGEEDRRLEAAHLTQQTGHTKHRRQATGVVSDSGSDQSRTVGHDMMGDAVGEDRVEVRTDYHGWGIGRAFEERSDIAYLVDHWAESARPERRDNGFGTAALPA